MPHTQRASENKVTIKQGSAGILKLRLRTMSRFSPVATLREDCIPWIPSAKEGIDTLLGRWMERTFPSPLRDIGAAELRRGMVSFTVLKEKKLKSGAGTGPGRAGGQVSVPLIVSSSRSSDPGALAKIQKCSEHNVVCIERPLVTMVPVSV